MPTTRKDRKGRTAPSKPAKTSRAPSRTPRKTAARTAKPEAGAEGQPGARAAVAQLEALGVEVVFGIPGVHNLALFDALRRSSIRTVVVRHEQTCVYAADGYARATGKLGVAITTTGPGAANTAAAMGEAKASRAPVLHISTQSHTRIVQNRSGRFSLHEAPHQRSLMDAVSVWSGTVARAEAIPSMIATAARTAFSGRRGPAFLEIPFDLLDQEVRWKPEPPPRTKRLIPEQRGVERAIAVLAAAEAPVIWSGGGAISSGADDVVAKLSEVLDAPVVTTYAGKGIVPPDHPLAVGAPPHEPAVTSLIESSDAVVFVGSDLDGMNTQGWRIAFPRPRVAINTIAEDGRRNYACDVVIEADARETLSAIVAGLPPRQNGSKRKRSAGATRVTAARKAVARASKAKDAVAGTRFVSILDEQVPLDAFVVADMAVAGYWAAAYWRAPAPRGFAFPLGWGTLGFALPAAVGAASAGRRVLAICGDGGLMFGIGELATIVQEGLPVCVLVANDEGYGMLRFDERERFRDTFAVDLHTPDLLAIGKAFGMKAKRCDLDGLGAALRWGMRRDEPTLIELRAVLSPPVSTSPRWPLRDREEARP